MAISFQTSMACLFQLETFGGANRSMQYFIDLENCLIKMDERLKLYKERELAESNWPADMDVGKGISLLSKLKMSIFYFRAF